MFSVIEDSDRLLLVSRKMLNFAALLTAERINKNKHYYYIGMKQLSPERSDMIRNIAIGGDFVLLNAAMIALYFILVAVRPLTMEQVDLNTYLVIANLCYIPCLSIFKIILHNRIVRPEIIVRRLVGTVCIHATIFITVLGLLDVGAISRIYLLYFYLFFLLLLVVWRLGLRRWVKLSRSRGQNVHTVVLVGGGDNMLELNHVMSEVTFGYKVEGMFFKGDTDGSYPFSEGYKAEMARLMAWLPEHPVQELYCGLPSVCQKDVLALIRYCENNMIRFYSVPNVRNYVKRQLQLTLLSDVPVLSIRREPLQRPMNRIIKRSFDLLCSSLFLVTIFPILYIVVGTIIKITSPGPIFFKQTRTGEDGRDFTCYKFRSMKVNKDSDKVQATKNDPRKTKFGNFLRKSNLDEMPQFINVFLGNMSLVGPRPHMLKHTEEYSHLVDKYMMRHLVKPGITGWAQVTGFRGETKELSQMEGRVKRDLWYIENWTFLLDLRIMLMTVTNMFRGEKNAY